MLKSWHFVALFFALTTAVALAQEDFDPASLNDVKIDKAAISQGIDLLVQSGQLTPEMAAQAKKELESKSEQDIKVLEQMAIKKIQSGDIPKLPPTATQSSSQTTSTPVVAPSTASAAKPTETVKVEKKSEEKSELDLREELKKLNN